MTKTTNLLNIGLKNRMVFEKHRDGLERAYGYVRLLKHAQLRHDLKNEIGDVKGAARVAVLRDWITRRYKQLLFNLFIKA